MPPLLRCTRTRPRRMASFPPRARSDSSPPGWPRWSGCRPTPPPSAARAPAGPPGPQPERRRRRLGPSRMIQPPRIRPGQRPHRHRRPHVPAGPPQPDRRVPGQPGQVVAVRPGPPPGPAPAPAAPVGPTPPTPPPPPPATRPTAGPARAGRVLVRQQRLPQRARVRAEGVAGRQVGWGRGRVGPAPAAARRAGVRTAAAALPQGRVRRPQPAHPVGKTRSVRSAQSPPTSRTAGSETGRTARSGCPPGHRRRGVARPAPVRSGSSGRLRTEAVGDPVGLVHHRDSGQHIRRVGRVHREVGHPGAARR